MAGAQHRSALALRCTGPLTAVTTFLCLLSRLCAVVTEAAVHGLSSPIAFVAALACALAGVLLRVTAAATS